MAKNIYLLSIIATLISSNVIATTTPENWSFLRQDENWENYYNNDFKHIKLNEKGDYWLSVGGHVRYRGELWKNAVFNETNNDVFHLGRATLHGDLHLGSNFRIFAEVKTANSTNRDLPGGKRPLDVDTLALQQAFVDYKIDKSRFRIGRQALSFGKQRLVSPLPWGNTLRTWEGARYDYFGEEWQTTAFLTRFVPVKQYDNNHANSDQKFSGIYTKGKITTWNTDFYMFNLSDETFQDLYTWGTNLNRKYTNWDVNLELALQTGTDKSDRDVSSSMLASEIGFKIDNKYMKRLSVGFDFASGDSDLSDEDTETFNQLFPLGHAYLGFADHIGRRNVKAANIAAMFNISPKISTRIALHTFYKAKKEDAIYNAGGVAIRPAPGNSDGASHIANELDITMTYKHSRHIKIDFGYSYIQSGKAIDETSNNDNVTFSYLSVNYLF